jgi:hypothetical protein
MTDDLSEDRGLKELFTAHPDQAVEALVPELIAARGKPATVEALPQELPELDLGEPSRFLDIALRCTWPEGPPVLIVLIEHWSNARRVDLVRTRFYDAGLRLRHPEAEVWPVILVTDPVIRPVAETLTASVLGRTIFTFHATVIRIGPEALPRLRQLQNLVAAVLSALAFRQVLDDAVEAAAAACELLVAAGTSLEELRRYLPLAAKLARMRDHQNAAFRKRVREGSTMVGNVLDDMWNEAVAIGEARGAARGAANALVAYIRGRVQLGSISIDEALVEIDRLVTAGAISAEDGAAARQQLG